MLRKVPKKARDNRAKAREKSAKNPGEETGVDQQGRSTGRLA
jgi:hypothetical protein